MQLQVAGSKQEAHLRKAAESGDETARRALYGDTEFPEALRPLWEIFETLSGMRGQATEYGAAPITIQDIHVGNTLFDWQLEPYEIKALRALDYATRNPGNGEDDDKE